jgi:hypothetical protein
LWIKSAPPDRLTSPTPTLLSSYGSIAECDNEIDNYDKGSQFAQKIPRRYSPTRLVIPYDGSHKGYREFLCLPDTVDPREAKGK